MAKILSHPERKRSYLCFMDTAEAQMEKRLSVVLYNSLVSGINFALCSVQCFSVYSRNKIL